MAPQSVPPSLPPSVEEAYRRKCVQLKSRTNDVEEANDAARLRLARAKRQVEKLRIERAFLLEQLAKRTSTNVEDSDGSPSPPPTEHHFNIISHTDANPRKPKDKPLRIKRGHRKTDQDSKGTPSASFNHHPVDPSPAPSDIGDAAKTRDANGIDEERKQSTKNAPRDGYELYCEKERPILENKAKDSDINVDEELERGWKELPESDKDEYRSKAQEEAKENEASSAKKNDDKPQDDKSQDDKSQDDKSQDDKSQDDKSQDGKSQDGKSQDDKSQDDKPEGGDEDVEMKNYDTEDAEPQADKEGED